MKLSKKCAVCGALFYKSKTVSLPTWNTKTKHCSRRCNALSVREVTIARNKAGVGKRASPETKAKLSLSRKGQVSSMKGRKHHSDTIDKIRASVLKAHTPEVRLKKSLAHRGEKSYNWKGGRTSLKHRMRTNTKYIGWRTSVFTRDNFTCTWCGDARGGNLQADHIIEVSTIFDTYKLQTIDQVIDCADLWDINNGRTLCKPCHNKRHKEDISPKVIIVAKIVQNCGTIFTS